MRPMERAIQSPHIAKAEGTSRAPTACRRMWRITNEGHCVIPSETRHPPRLLQRVRFDSGKGIDDLSHERMPIRNTLSDAIHADGAEGVFPAEGIGEFLGFGEERGERVRAGFEAREDDDVGAAFEGGGVVGEVGDVAEQVDGEIDAVGDEALVLDLRVGEVLLANFLRFVSVCVCVCALRWHERTRTE